MLISISIQTLSGSGPLKGPYMEIAIQALWLNQGQFRSILQGLHTIVYTFSNLKFALFAFQLTFVQLGKGKGGGVCLLYPPVNTPLIFWKGIIQLNFMTIVELHPNVYISYFLIKTEDEFKMFFYIYTCPYKILHASSFIL